MAAHAGSSAGTDTAATALAAGRAGNRPTIVKAHKRKKHATNQEKLPEDAEIEVVTMELPTEERVCPECGDEMF